MKYKLLLCSIFMSLFSASQINTETQNYKDIILNTQSGLKPDDLDEIIITTKSFDKKNGVTHLYFNQIFKGIYVYNAVLGLHLDKNNKVVEINNTFIKNIKTLPHDINNKVSVNDAAQIAVLSKIEIGKLRNDKGNFEITGEKNGDVILKNASLKIEDIHVKKYWVGMEGKIVLAWNVNWQSPDGQNWWNIRIDAINGNIIDENNWINHCNFKKNSEEKTLNINYAPAEASAEGNSGAKYRVLQMPIESPSHGNMSLLTDPSDSLASPFNWHDVNGVSGNDYTITRGNNVYASDDKDNNNTPGYSPDGGSKLIFDYSFDKTKRHSDYLDAAITNLFYWNNLMHDVWYHYGFDEESGNFQQNNYSRGGLGNDYVEADAQDGSGTNNANFATPPDGQNPRMQMYVWNVSSSSFLLRVTQPFSIAKVYSSVLASFGPKLTTTPITGNLVLVNDGTASPSLGCQSLINGSAINGNIALIDRGTCKFAEKVKFAQDKGAKAAIIINNVSGSPFTMGGDGVTSPSIPSIMISKADGDLIKSILSSQTVKVSLYDSIGSGGKQYDSDFDNGIISHEYGHGISNRLTGGASNTDCLTNQEQMGEGWSDFFSLVMTHKAGDKSTDKRGIGTYVIDQTNDGDGIRDYPYSTSMTINPVTYDNIKTFSVPHGVGSVWCSMIWDMYWNFIDRYGYDSDIYNGNGGNNMAMKLILDGMKLQPCNPGFVNGRDAILKADKINNNGVNQDIIWKAFARRGLGYSSSQGSSNSRSDGTSAYDVPKSDLPIIIKSTIDEVKTGDTLVYSILLKNNNFTTVKNLILTDTLANELNYIKSENCIDGNISGNIFKADIDSIASGDSVLCKLYIKVSSGNYSIFEETSDFENDINGWNDTNISNTPVNWSLNSIKFYKGKKSYFISNLSTQSDNAIEKELNLDFENPHLLFYHYFNTESEWDGAVIEIFDNGNWEDLNDYIIENSYNSTISSNPQSSISQRKAFTGKSNGFVRTIIDLSSFKGKKVKIRFRFVSDGAQGAEGWYIDNISLLSKIKIITNTAYIKSLSGNKDKSTVNTIVLKEISNTSIKKYKYYFSILPNPFNEKLSIKSAKTNYNVIITEITGRQIINIKNLKNDYTINTSEFSAGTYILKIFTDKGIENFKLIKTDE
ncbi:MAG: T9SS-dependent M36 family metallopeptidase [Bacteroidia bacterium]|nr:T9SS-dependent M36 family metallopeptidase [Bacteroidia bacterium]